MYKETKNDMINIQRIVLITIALLFFFGDSHGQQNVSTSGIIQFQKKVNNHAQFKNMFDDQTPQGKRLIDNFTKMTEPFDTFYFSLEYADNNTLYKSEEYVESRNILSEITAQNAVFTDLDQKHAISAMTIFDKKINMDEKTMSIKWKLTDETRNIAGYNCIRANGVFGDSIYVVAFYTEDIALSGGPEHFNGLPGMILGIALPHDHVTWFATKVYKRSTSGPVQREFGGAKISRSEIPGYLKKAVIPKIKIKEEMFDRIMY